ncbi:hypothetical protein ACLK2B_13860 [Escherichia coli]
MRNMGGMMGMLDKLPGMSGLPDNMKEQMDDKLTVRMEAIISSMTPRSVPILISSRVPASAVSAGSRMQLQDVNKLLKQFTEMQRMMKKMSGKGGMRKMMGQNEEHAAARIFGGGGISRSALIFLLVGRKVHRGEPFSCQPLRKK